MGRLFAIGRLLIIIGGDEHQHIARIGFHLTAGHIRPLEFLVVLRHDGTSLVQIAGTAFEAVVNGV